MSPAAAAVVVAAAGSEASNSSMSQQQQRQEHSPEHDVKKAMRQHLKKKLRGMNSESMHQQSELPPKPCRLANKHHAAHLFNNNHTAVL
jgi:hypothetical protein